MVTKQTNKVQALRQDSMGANLSSTADQLWDLLQVT